MKKLSIVFMLFFYTALLFSQTRVVVMPFNASDNELKDKVDYITNVFTTSLCQNNAYTVLERRELDKAMSELRLQNSDDFDDSTAAEIGQIAGAEKVFLGEIYPLGKGYAISLRCVDIQTSAISFAKKGSARNMPELEIVTKKIATQIRQGNTSETEVSIGLTKLERQFSNDYLRGKWGIRSTDKTNMKKYFYRHFISGLVLAGAGATCLTFGVIITPVLCNQTINWTEEYKIKTGTHTDYQNGGVIVDDYETIYEDKSKPDETCIAVGASVGTLLLLGAAVMLPVSLVPLIFSKMIYSIYHKSTGEKLLATFTGGYNWDRKELTFAMNIKF